MTINDFVVRLSHAQNDGLIAAVGKLRSEENMGACLQAAEAAFVWQTWAEDSEPSPAGAGA